MDLMTYEQYAAWCRGTCFLNRVGDTPDPVASRETVPCVGDDESYCPPTVRSAGHRVVITPTIRGSK